MTLSWKDSSSPRKFRYVRFIGDGDSSVSITLVQCVPVWGRFIEKMKCANHCCKCYHASIEKLVKEKPSYKGKGGLTEKMRRRLTSAARCAIKMRNQEADVATAVKKLERDLINSPFHCFGQHEGCSSAFCQTARENENVLGPSNSHDSCDGEHKDCEPTHDCDELQGRVPAINIK